MIICINRVNQLITVIEVILIISFKGPATQKLVSVMQKCT